MSNQVTEAERQVSARRELAGLLVESLNRALGMGMMLEASVISALITAILNDTVTDLAIAIKANC